MQNPKEGFDNKHKEGLLKEGLGFYNSLVSEFVTGTPGTQHKMDGPLLKFRVHALMRGSINAWELPACDLARAS